MTLYPGTTLAYRFFSGNGASYDNVVSLCTLGADRWWKRKILNSLCGRPRRIIDQACGTGILTFKLAHKFPRAHIIGIDLHGEYIEVAKKKAAVLKRTNVEFIVGRAEDIAVDGPVDAITSSYLAKYAELSDLVSNAEKMLASNGVLVMHDFIYPPNRLFARIWEMHFKMLQSLGGRHYPAWQRVFHELPILLRTTRWPLQLTRILRNYAFTDITFTAMTFGVSALITCRKV
jgi:demethylmenaquinone methyltransferase/2-methoxy-6-polyprenyl-1,4-benzoquinol methylase